MLFDLNLSVMKCPEGFFLFLKFIKFAIQSNQRRMINWNKNSNGDYTRKLLKKRKIKSPPLVGGILIAKGLTVYPKEQPKDIPLFIAQQRAKFKLD